MLTVTYVELNIFALVILFLIFININKRPDRLLFEQSLFMGLLISNAVILVFDSIMWILDGKTGMALTNVDITITTVYYSLNPIPCLIWSLYAHFLVYNDKSSTLKLLKPLLIPAALNAVLCVASCFLKNIFYFDSHNYYHRGSSFFIMPCICFAYLFMTLFFIIIKRRQITKDYFIPILFFVIPPIIGAVVQSLFYGVSVIWVSMTISVLIIFMNIQNDQLYTDHLTGLYNRRQLDRFLYERKKYSNKGNRLAGIMIDLDCFKSINDRWGHSTGDKALKDTGKILKSCFKSPDLICRYGGDEFVVLFEIEKKSDLIDAVDRIRLYEEQYSKSNSLPCCIHLSMGYDIFDYDSGVSLQQFLKHIDGLMYEDKKRFKKEKEFCDS